MRINAIARLKPLAAGTDERPEAEMFARSVSPSSLPLPVVTSATAGDEQDAVTSSWVQRIHAALRDDDFVLYAQPIVELASDKVTRHEILLRMVDDGGEHISPMEFLPTAERCGLVKAIDVWVIRKAIELIAAQARRGERLELEVNISGVSVTDPELLAVIESEITDAGIDPGSLIFEITETAAIVNIEQARIFAEHLAKLGCGFALDDFGAGFGSFFYLKHLPFDTLKIDGEFVRGLTESERDQIMVKAIAQVALELGTETVAEFVSDDATCKLLRDYGVHYAQGYGVGRPQPVTVTWPNAFADERAQIEVAAPRLPVALAAGRDALADSAPAPA